MSFFQRCVASRDFTLTGPHLTFHSNCTYQTLRPRQRDPREMENSVSFHVTPAKFICSQAPEGLVRQWVEFKISILLANHHTTIRKQS